MIYVRVQNSGYSNRSDCGDPGVKPHSPISSGANQKVVQAQVEFNPDFTGRSLQIR